MLTSHYSHACCMITQFTFLELITLIVFSEGISYELPNCVIFSFLLLLPPTWVTTFCSARTYLGFTKHNHFTDNGTALQSRK